MVDRSTWIKATRTTAFATGPKSPCPDNSPIEGLEQRSRSSRSRAACHRAPPGPACPGRESRAGAADRAAMARSSITCRYRYYLGKNQGRDVTERWCCCQGAPSRFRSGGERDRTFSAAIRHLRLGVAARGQLSTIYRRSMRHLDADRTSTAKSDQRIILAPTTADFISSATLLTKDQQSWPKYSVQYVASGHDLLRPCRPTPPKSVLFANPDFDLAPQKCWPGR